MIGLQIWCYPSIQTQLLFLTAGSFLTQCFISLLTQAHGSQWSTHYKVTFPKTVSHLFKAELRENYCDILGESDETSQRILVYLRIYLVLNTVLSECLTIIDKAYPHIVKKYCYPHFTDW